MEKENEVCELHKSLACEVDKGKFIRRIFGSKIIISIIGTAFLFAISWGVWVTNFTYVSKKVSENIDEVKQEMKEIKNEIKSQTEAINKSQQDMLKLFIEIQKEQRRSNGGQKSNTR